MKGERWKRQAKGGNMKDEDKSELRGEGEGAQGKRAKAASDEMEQQKSQKVDLSGRSEGLCRGRFEEKKTKTSWFGSQHSTLSAFSPYDWVPVQTGFVSVPPPLLVLTEPNRAVTSLPRYSGPLNSYASSQPSEKRVCVRCERAVRNWIRVGRSLISHK